MAAIALIQFDQGGPGTAGQAFEGTVAGGVVTVTNGGDNSSVTSWSVDLLDVPSGSALVPGSLAVGVRPPDDPQATFTPDVTGCYRIRMTVSDGVTPDVDIRNFGIRNARNIIVPPHQKLPDPLPLLGSGDTGEKPDELNFSGQTRGWGGTPTTGLMEEFFTTYDDNPSQLVNSTPFTAAPTGEAPLYVVDLPTLVTGTFNLPLSPVAGKTVRIATLGPMDPAERLTVTPQGGGSIGAFSSIDMFGDTGATFVHRSSNAWSVIGGQHESVERDLVSGIQNTDTTGWTVVGATEIDLSDFLNAGSSVIWKIIGHTSNVADPAQMRLFNVTTAAVVAGSTLNFTTTSSAVQQATVTLPAGSNVYEAHLRLTSVGAPNRAFCSQAQLIVSDFQP